MRESFRLLEIFSRARAAGVSANLIRGPNLLFCAILEQCDRKGVEVRDARQSWCAIVLLFALIFGLLSPARAISDRQLIPKHPHIIPFPI